MIPCSTAEIIAFPVAPMQEVGRQRLARSLARLQAAAAEQVVAVAVWRGQLDRLRIGMGELGQSLEAYGSRLESAREGVVGLNAQARRLESWAEDVLAR
jgi:hypothetical protein